MDHPDPTRPPPPAESLRMSFPPPFRHAPPAAINVNEMMEERLTRGQRAADAVAATMGSWHFISSRA
jgi:uncharacterized membrane protein